MARQDAKCYNLKEEKKKTYVTSKVWYREFSRISNIGITIIEKWIAFRDRDALNSNPAIILYTMGSLCRSESIPGSIILLYFLIYIMIRMYTF